MFDTVLYPIDQSRESLEAAGMVMKIVQTHGSKLTILSVIDEAEDGEKATATKAAVGQLLQKVKELMDQQNISAKTLEKTGKPAFTICDVADEIEADLIIMGCRGIGLIEDGVTESVSNRVVNLSPCPVLIVP